MVISNKSYLKGINEETIKKISLLKKEPEWMLNLRLHSLEIFKKKNMPNWGPNISDINFNEIIPYVLGFKKTTVDSWDNVPEEIKKVYDDLGIIKEEQKTLAGLGAQYQSEVVYNKIKKVLKEKGVIFLDMDSAVKLYPEIVKKHFMKCVPVTDNKFAALHGAVWSGGSFVYIPKGVKLKMPLQGYFYMFQQLVGQFEHTIIIADDDSELHYIEGCSAPQYRKLSLHVGVVEVYVGKNAKIRFTSVQNWAKNIYNLSTKRAIVEENGIIEWISGSLGSGVTMLYPCSILKGKNSKAKHLSITMASKGQEIDTGAKVYHLAKNTRSLIKSKSISLNGGVSTYRGFVRIGKKAEHSRSSVECDSIIVDNYSKASSYPTIKVMNNSSIKTHEAKVGKISDDQLFYLMSRGISKENAKEMIVNGFIEPILKDIPFEYAIEFNKLISLEIKHSIG